MNRVSICTSVLNQTALLRGMIASVIGQSFKDWELIVVDDGSMLEDVKAECDYCGKLARVRMIGNDLVCDKCLGTVEQGAGETELERCTR